MPTSKRRRQDFDSPWKEALEQFFPAFLGFFYSEIYAEIDWSRGYRSLDKELHQLTRDARVSKGLADKLFQVWLRTGEEAWLLIHVEIQGEAQAEFPGRMFIYNVRAIDRYNRTVVSLAVLTDEQEDWRPDTFAYGRWGANTSIRFLTAKLLDYRGREQDLERADNPFAQVVAAHLRALETRRDASGRLGYKLQLIKGLYHRGFGAEEVRQLFRLIDWLMDLPAELQTDFHTDVQRWEEEQRMPYITSVERYGMTMAFWKAIEASLQFRFGAAGKRLMPRVRKIFDAEQLEKLHRSVLEAEDIKAVRELLPR